MTSVDSEFDSATEQIEPTSQFAYYESKICYATKNPADISQVPDVLYLLQTTPYES